MPLEPGAIPAADMESRAWAEWCKKQKPGPRVTEDDYANDAAAEAGGIPVGGLYHSSGTVKVRIA